VADISKAFHPVRFGESLHIATDNLNSRNFYAFNPDFDTKQAKAEMARNG
jgi:hypothetical protein